MSFQTHKTNYGIFDEIGEHACVVVLSKMVEDGNLKKNCWIKSFFISLCTKSIPVAAQN